jgi:hypothetical protein
MQWPDKLTLIASMAQTYYSVKYQILVFFITITFCMRATAKTDAATDYARCRCTARRRR